MSVGEGIADTCDRKAVSPGRVRTATLNDIPALVALHKRAFPDAFLTFLGDGFLRELYRGFIVSASGICVVADSDARLAGCVAGTTAPAGYFRGLLLRRWIFFVLAAVGAMASRPILVTRRLAGAMRYRGEEPATLQGSGALLSSIGVDPSCAGAGVGKMLVDEFFRRAAAANAAYVYLTTDADNNEAVNGFYQRYGFKMESTFVKNGARSMHRYTMPVQKQ